MTAMAWSVGTLQANEAFLVATPRIKPAVLKPPVIFCPQAGGLADFYRNGDLTAEKGGRARFLLAVAEAGHVCIAGDFGGQLTFGNPLVQSRVLQGWTWLQNHPWSKPGPAILFGTSMGNMTATNFARANPEKTRGIISAFGMVDLTGTYEENTGNFQEVIGTAWGVVYPTPLPVEADPMDHTEEMEGIPWRGWYAQDDPLVDGAETEAFAAAMPDGAAVNTGFQGHDDDVIFYGWDAMFAQIEAWS